MPRLYGAFFIIEDLSISIVLKNSQLPACQQILNGIDLNVTTQTQKTADLPLMEIMMGNLKNALIYKGIFPN